MASEKNLVKDTYAHVVNDVIEGVREAFLDDGMDELVLQELKQLWESKLAQCKAVDRAPPPAPDSAVLVSPNRPQQASLPIVQPVNSAPILQTSITQLPPGAIALQPQLMRLQAAGQATGPIFNNISQLTPSAQIAANSLPTALVQRIVGYAPGQNPKGIVIQGIHPAALTQMTAVAPADVGVVVTNKSVIQLDGLGDSSSEDDDPGDDDDDDNDDDEDDDQNDDVDDTDAKEEDPLNSSDDVSDADPTEVFDAENVVVCQFEKINRCKNRWKFHLKDGIMNLNGRDHLFQKASGDAEW